jgi:hypothetical protein
LAHILKEQLLAQERKKERCPLGPVGSYQPDDDDDDIQ